MKIYLNSLTKKITQNQALIFISLSWLIICSSVGTLFEYHLFRMINQQSVLSYFNGSRVILSILIIVIFIICNLFLFNKNNFFKCLFKFNIINIYLFYFISQLMGLIQNNSSNFNFNNFYLLFLAFGTLNFIIFVSKPKFESFLENLFYLVLAILFLANFYILSTKFNMISELLMIGLYNISDANELLFDQAIPRVTGLGRSIAILNLFLIIGWFHLRHNLNWIKKSISMLLILTIGLLIWSLNSRGAIICYIFALSIYLFIILRDRFSSRIKFFTLIVLTPILFFSIFNIYIGTFDIKNKIDTENYNTNNSIRLLNNRNNSYSSGRTELWEYSINNYDTNKIFGYGPQGDRYLLEEKFSHYGSNVSNGALYALLSGGYFGLFFFILLYLKVIFNITITIFNPKLLRKNYIVSCSVIFVSFFLLRSTVENSFALFSVDFLIFIISNVLIEKFIKNKKIKINLSK